ncbi:hypothetical protein BDR26DRAFT_428374 [Obelidium mucronatum]|nr:hypothetical protein BDR26DRAFT_428374 [Obelidium mucronatum]
MLRNQDHAYRSMQPSCQTQKIDTFRRAAKSAVGVPEILAIIFHFLSNADIAACRLVNKSWNLTSADAILARSNNLLHVVLIVSEAVNNLTSSFMSKFSKSSRINEELIKHALELAVTRSGVDSKACSVQREIDSLIETHPIIHSLSNSGGNGPANMYLVPITLQCVDHNISQDSQTLVRKFVPTTRYYECAETHTPSSGGQKELPFLQHCLQKSMPENQPTSTTLYL